MTLKLVPDEEQTMTEDQARTYLMKLTTPELTALRAKIPTMRTSEVLGVMGNPEMLASMLGLHEMDSNKSQEIFMAGMLAVAEELDRRIPIPS